MADEENEIWSEFFRIKNRLMDYDENLREPIALIRMLQKQGHRGSRLNTMFAKAQKHVGMILDLGLSCGAIPVDADQDKIKKIQSVARGEWKNIKDFEECQEYFREFYQKTKFYNVTVTKDNRPAVVRKYGKAKGIIE